MFIQNLNINQQGVLLSLAEEVIKADGDLHELQLEMLSILKEQADKNAQPIPIKLSNLAELFSSKREKYSLMFELIAIAHANREYHDNERKLISDYAYALNIEKENLNILENWVQQQIELVKKAEDLMAEVEQ